MPEIIPNLHPVFVHFTVALLSISVGLFLVLALLQGRLPESLHTQWHTVARWNLWLGAAITLITGIAGLYAYNTVAHDTPSHAAMTDHRNWAVATIILFTGLAAWSIARTRATKPHGRLFVVVLVIAGVVLLSTAWRGGEVVYRYGVGVMSLPKAEGEGHDHSHGDGNDHGSDTTTGIAESGHDDHGEKGHHDEMEMDFSNMDSMKNDDGHNHAH
jgi:uncharacterized membrane protein